jgi:hypothetical protein
MVRLDEEGRFEEAVRLASTPWDTLLAVADFMRMSQPAPSLQDAASRSSWPRAGT